MRSPSSIRCDISKTWNRPSRSPSLCASYFLAAANNWRAPILLQARWNEKSPFYWEGPDGKRVLFASTRVSENGRFSRLFTIAVAGVFPEALPLPMGSEGVLSPDGWEASR